MPVLENFSLATESAYTVEEIQACEKLIIKVSLIFNYLETKMEH